MTSCEARGRRGAAVPWVEQAPLPQLERVPRLEWATLLPLAALQPPPPVAAARTFLPPPPGFGLSLLLLSDRL